MINYIKILIIIFLYFSFYVDFAVAKPNIDDPPVVVPARMDSTKLYFARLGLSVDSSSTPTLYYQIFDWLGTRYKYSGKTKKGIDCSGFVAEMYRQSYCIAIKGRSADLYLQVNTILFRDSLKEGDILFFKIKKGQISHVGIYLGHQLFAHASVHSGVIVSSLNETYYKKYFFQGGRLKKPAYID